MNAVLKSMAAIAVLIVASHAAAQVTFYEHDNFSGRSFTPQGAVDDFRRYGFNDLASSVVVQGAPWEVCENVGFQGRCYVLRPGNYRSLHDMNLDDRLSSARELSRDARYDESRYAPQPLPASRMAGGQITLYEREGFRGRVLATEREIGNFQRTGFNDRASSVVVLGERWEACDDADFRGRCVILRPGSYPSLVAMGLNDRLSSVRPVAVDARFDDRRYAPLPVAAYDWRRRPQEQVFLADVTSAHAVFSSPRQRCWIEREQVTQAAPQIDTTDANGAMIGILGAILGVDTQGAVATQDVQRCTTVPNQTPDYWDVTYRFNGIDHHLQTSAPPGRTISVNERGEPRM